MKIDKKAVGMRISQIRKSKGLTLEEFGKLVDNAGKSIVSKWERGITVPNNERLKRISEIANVSTTYLTTGKYTEYDLTKGNKTLFIDEFKSRREEEKKATLLRIEEAGTIDIGLYLKALDEELLDRFRNAGENHSVIFNGHPLTSDQLAWIGEILEYFAEIDVSKYSVDSLEEMYSGFGKLLSKYRSDL